MGKPSSAILRHLFRVAISIAILLAVVYVLPDSINDLPEALSNAPLGAFVVSFLLNVVGTIILPAFATQMALGIGRVSIPIGELISLNFIIRFYSLILPKGGAMAIRWRRYSKSGKAGDALALLIFEKVLSFLVMAVVAFVALLVDFEEAGSAGAYLLGMAALAVVGTGLPTLPFLSAPVATFLEKVVGYSGKIIPAFIHSRMLRLLEAVTAFQKLGGIAVAKVVFYSFAGYILFVLGPWVLVWGMGIDVPLLTLAWMRSLVFFLTLIPITIAGLGVREAGFITLFSFYGLDSTSAVAFSVLLLATQLLIGLVGVVIEGWQQFVSPKPPNVSSTEDDHQTSDARSGRQVAGDVSDDGRPGLPRPTDKQEIRS